ncbi:hypothetical protein ASD19_03120 [Microbacterium sp. Root53]|uniref:DUF4245 family protein n=1 Tax=Microbacterium sp. Root53 TaxID=1736553 RepID=UPI0006FD0568|nr:DUF4245 family protein [Microbacterium sp. Root53]KQZ05008.1 hypothetical protein ASD19_03120 [Microbacterium sp. Root53]
MAREPRIVAELGRPETPEETAARKAANSKAYRESQNIRNLVIALVATLAIVLVIVWAVPRGEPAPRPGIDPEPIAEVASETYGTAIVPPVPGEEEGWRVNQAQVEPGAPASWNIVYVPGDESFLRFSQGFDADATWAAQRLGGTAPSGEVDIAGITWQTYDVNPDGNANVSYALGTQAGADHVLLYGSSTPEKTAEVAELIAPQLLELMKEQE